MASNNYTPTNLTNSKYDKCFQNQQRQFDKSIFNYVVDRNMFVNSNDCYIFNPPFLAYVPTGVLSQNIDVENDLKGLTRVVSKCEECKHQRVENIDRKIVNLYPHTKPECKLNCQIYPKK